MASRRRPTPDQLFEFAQRSKLVNLDVSVEQVATAARALRAEAADADDGGVNILMLSGYFIIYPGAEALEDQSLIK